MPSTVYLICCLILKLSCIQYTSSVKFDGIRTFSRAIDLYHATTINIEHLLTNGSFEWDTISYPLFVRRIRKGTYLKESVFPEAEG